MKHLKTYKYFFENLEVNPEDQPDQKVTKKNINNQSDWLKEYTNLAPKIENIYKSTPPNKIDEEIKKIIKVDNKNPYLSSLLKFNRIKSEIDGIKKRESDDKIKLDDFKRDLALLAPNVDKTSINAKILEVTKRLSEYKSQINLKNKELQKFKIEHDKKMIEIKKELDKNISEIEKK
jgi:hypothetical protein